jgi:hypothetical protein
MSFPDDITRILDILMTLLQSSLGVIVVAERVWHAGIALHCHRVACRLKKLGVFVRLISTEIILCRDDVCWGHAFEGLGKYRRRHPVVQRGFSKVCVQSLASMCIGGLSISLLTCVFRYPMVHEPVHA